MHAVTDRITRKWWAVDRRPGLAGAMGVVSAVGEAQRTASSTDALPIGSDSAAALQLRDRLPEAEGTTAVVLFSKASGTLSPPTSPPSRGACRSCPAPDAPPSSAATTAPPHGGRPRRRDRRDGHGRAGA